MAEFGHHGAPRHLVWWFLGSLVLVVGAFVVVLNFRSELSVGRMQECRCDDPGEGKAAAAAAEKAKPVPKGQAPISDREAMEALRKMGKIINNFPPQGTGRCVVQTFGAGQSVHDLCQQPHMVPCIGIGYGIDRNWDFELHVQQRLGCDVFALDPTITHPSELAPHLYFLKWGAPMLDPRDIATDGFRKANEGWFSISPAALAHMVAPGQAVPVLKMDCEGCEYAIYSGVMKHDPSFFGRVGQFTVEFHTSKFFMKGNAELLEYGRLIGHLFANGFTIESVALNPCAPWHESFGVLPNLTELGYHDGKRHMCENFLFVRW